GVLSDKTGWAPEELRGRLPVLVTTLGKEGSVIEGQKVGEPKRVGVAKPDKVVDPTGAGDAYRAGFLYGYLREWDLVKCGQLGAVLASLIIERHGTQRRFSKPEVIKRYQANFKGEIEL